MARALVAIALSDLGRDAIKFVMALALAIILALAFSVSTLLTVLGAPVPQWPKCPACCAITGDAPELELPDGWNDAYLDHGGES